MLRTSAASRRKASQFHASANNTPSSQRRSSLRNTIETPVTRQQQPTLSSEKLELASPTAGAYPESSAVQAQASAPKQTADTPSRFGTGGGFPHDPINLASSPEPEGDHKMAAEATAIADEQNKAESSLCGGGQSVKPVKPAEATARSITGSASASYASSLASSRQGISHNPSISHLDDSDSSLSELSSSSDEDSDDVDRDDDEEAEVEKALRRTPSASMQASSGSRAGAVSVAEVDSVLATPSRRSARISVSGSSMQSASARRDEMDERLLGKTPSPVQAMIEKQNQLQKKQQEHQQPQPTDAAGAVPAKRGRGRPRKIRPEEGQPDLSAVQSTPASTPKPAKPAREASTATPPTIRARSTRLRPSLIDAPATESSPSSTAEIPRKLTPAELAASTPPASISGLVSLQSPGTESITDTPVKRKRGRPPGSGKKQLAAKAAAAAAAAAGVDNIGSSPVGSTMPPASGNTAKQERIMSPAAVAGPEAQGSRLRGKAMERIASISTPSRLASETPSVSTPSAAKRPKQAAPRRLDEHTSGLYHNSVSRSNSVASGADGEGNVDSGLSRSPAFPEPMHFGYQLLTEERPFRLPPGWLEDAARLRAKLDAKRKPPPYAQIKSNKYFSRPKLQGELPQCQCAPSSNCGDGCMNRILQYVCSPKNCPCGERCTNVSLGKRPNVKTEVVYYGARGFGLRSLEDIPKGGFIDEYRGEVIDQAETNRRTEEYKLTGNYYFLSYDHDAGEFLDGGRKGNITRFANHSCDPNCYIEKWLLCGTDESRTADFQIGLFALKDIKAGDELTYDYGWSYFRPRTVSGDYIGEPVLEPCYCGAANCSGVLGGKKIAPKTVAAGDKKTTSAKTKRKVGRPKGLANKLAKQTLSHANTMTSKSGRGRKKQEQEIVVQRAKKIIAKRAELERKSQLIAQKTNQEPGSTVDSSLTISSDSSDIEPDELQESQAGRPGVEIERASGSFPTNDEADKRWNEEFMRLSKELVEAEELFAKEQEVHEAAKRAFSKAQSEHKHLEKLSEKGSSSSSSSSRGGSTSGGVSRVNPRHLEHALREAFKKVKENEIYCAIKGLRASNAFDKVHRIREALTSAKLRERINVPPDWSPLRGAATSAAAAATSSRGQAVVSTEAPTSTNASHAPTMNGTRTPSPTKKGKSKGKDKGKGKGKEPAMPTTPISAVRAGKQKATPISDPTQNLENEAEDQSDYDSEDSEDDALDDDDDESASDGGPARGKKRKRARSSSSSGRRPKRPKEDLTPEEMEAREAQRRERNAFLARKRRAKKRGIIIEDPTQHPLRKQSIQCEAAPEDTYIPDLPSSLIELGMTKADARRVRNAFLARVRRAKRRGNDETAAINMAAKPLPADESQDSPVIRAHLAHLAGGGQGSPSASTPGSAVSARSPSLGSTTASRLPLASPLAYRSINQASDQGQGQDRGRTVNGIENQLEAGPSRPAS